MTATAITIRLAHRPEDLAHSITAGLPGRDLIVARGHVPLTITEASEEAEAVVVMRDTGTPKAEVQATPVALLSPEHGNAWQTVVLCVADNLLAVETQPTSFRQAQTVLDEAFEAYLHFTGSPD